MSKEQDIPLNELALFGGNPHFEELLHVGRPNIGDRKAFLSRVEDILDRRWLTNNGPMVQEFEKRICDLLGVKHCVAVCNATVGLELTIRALNLTGEVIVPSLTFIATAHALQWQEITPVFCDVNPSKLCLDPDCVECMITPRTTGIIGVHLWGTPCDIDKLAEIAQRRNLKLIFDAAHAFGCSYAGTRIGNFGHAEVFSFHATKFLNCFEGGAITTNDDVLAAKLRLMKNFGFSGYDKVTYIGTNGKMSEVSAAMGLTSLESMDTIIARNRDNHGCYAAQLSSVKGLKLRSYDDSEHPNYQYIVVEVDEQQSPLSRDELMRVLQSENVAARRYFYPGCHRMEPYLSYFPHSHLLLPVTERALQGVLLLPNGTAIGEEEISLICGIIRTASANAESVRQRIVRSMGEQ